MMNRDSNPSAPASGPVLEVDDLCTYFRTGSGTARAVDGLTFSIDPGESYALVGESGCGKSVAALSVLQLIPAPAGYIAGGRVRLRGREISSLPPVAMRRIRGNDISMIFQEPMTALNPVFTVGSQVSEVFGLHRGMPAQEARRAAVEMLRRVGIPDPAARCDEYPHQLSGGMRQRVMIAMALACRPDVLLADEPTTALDVTIQAQILELMRQLRSETRTAVLLITHDMGVVRENADRVGVMYAGRIVEEAPHARVFDAPAHPYTRLLLRSLPSRARRDRTLTTIPGTVPRATDFPAGCRFSNRCPYVMEQCRREQPPRYGVAEGHTAECFLLDRASPASVAPPPEQAVSATRIATDDGVRLRTEGLQMHFPIRKGVLQHTTGAVRAVDGISLTIGTGETLALVGESGCGKTTVGKCIVRLLHPTAGTIRLHDVEVTRVRGKELKGVRRRIQMIFQDPFSSLNPRLMVGESIAEGMSAHGIGDSAADRRATAGHLLEQVGLHANMLDRYPHEFSGGQRQRIGIARALALEPELLICDEATSSLDVSVQAQILNLLKRLQAELGLSYLFITHDLSVVHYLADRVSVMYLGRIVEQGSTEAIFGAPRHPYTRALLAAVPRIDAAGRKKVILAGDVPSAVHPPAGCRFHPRCPYAVADCARIEPSLEEPRNEPGAGRLVACIRTDEI